MNGQNPVAYKGNEPFIFISYAHKDSEIVLPVIRRLQNDGNRVWYDEGIAPGSQWDVYISEHLQGSASVLCFLSQAYLRSQNCRDELALARANGKPMNMIYIDDVQLSAGLKMRYGRIQALFMNKMQPDELFEKLYRSDAIMLARRG